MKIKKFNENLDKKEITDYIDECFVEFSDMGHSFEKDGEVYCMTMPIYESNGNDPCNMSNFLSVIEKTYNMSLSLQVCVERVISRYPDMIYTFAFGHEGDTTNIDLWFDVWEWI